MIASLGFGLRHLQRDARLRLRGTSNVFVIGDVAEKSADERLASFAHWRVRRLSAAEPLVLQERQRRVYHAAS